MISIGVNVVKQIQKARNKIKRFIDALWNDSDKNWNGANDKWNEI